MSIVVLDWLLTASPRQDPAVEQRLMESMLTRKATLLFASVSIAVLATYAYITHTSEWPIVWVFIEVILLIIRLRLIEHVEANALQSDRRAYYYLLTCGSIWSVVTGVACAICIAHGNITLSLMAAITITGMFGGVASRNAPTPRYAVWVLILLGTPFSIGLYLSPIPQVGALYAVLPLWFMAMCVLVLQNYHLHVRAVQADLTNQFLATHDLLTGLLNRVALERTLDILCNSLALDPSNKAFQFTLLCIDLDGFKAVNDRWGHSAGDTLLKSAGEAIRRSIRKEDSLYRLGGDEFIVLAPNCSSEASESLVDRINRSMATDVDLGDGRIARIGLSIGSSNAPEHGTSAEKLIQSADEALYQAKRDGKGVHRKCQPRAMH